ncbi:MAG: hypothetical protein JO099_15340 [Acidobacteriia bacterium]|nr:hypothetical protein [Terriglobia bacterium]
MKPRILSALLLATPWATLVKAADPQLLNLVMPDAKILAGVNVDQAKTSPFGQYVILQIQANDPHFQQFVTQTGFDPTKDLDELLVASNGAAANASHLTLARGTFNMSQIDAAATNAGATLEVYKGQTILEDPQHKDGFTFLSGTLAVAGDIASVKGAIDRQTAPSTLPAALLVSVNQLSTTEDAWGVSQVPPPAFKPPANAPNIPNLPNIPSTVFQNIQQATGGIKFGTQVTLNAQLVADTAQNATAVANVLQFLVNLGEMRDQQNPQAVAALQAVSITASGNTVNITGSIAETQLEALAKMKPQEKGGRQGARRPGSQQPQRF